MSDEEKFVECVSHGKQHVTFVCQHIVQTLRDRKPRGFFCAYDPENPRSDAWCSECDEKLKASGDEWNDENEAFAGVKILCGECYDDAKKINHDK